jgi:hypothetical protein
MEALLMVAVAAAVGYPYFGLPNPEEQSRKVILSMAAVPLQFGP